MTDETHENNEAGADGEGVNTGSDEGVVEGDGAVEGEGLEEEWIEEEEDYGCDDDGGAKRVRLETTEGDIVIELLPEVAPKTVNHFKQLCHEGFYDNLTFHRIIPEFMIQGGCPVGDGTGGPGYTVDAEFSDLRHEAGVVSMARTADPNSAGSQFFICLGRKYCAHLDGEYTVFGKVVEGMESVENLAKVELESKDLGTPVHPPMIIHAYEVWDDDHYHDHHEDHYHHIEEEQDMDHDGIEDGAADRPEGSPESTPGESSDGPGDAVGDGGDSDGAGKDMTD